ncbi:hypothetical protein GCM10008066_23370 [Oxalicibacterium faecigallinarum]|uniref:Uncharacterized protein n=1 Tax=Oxalicibacterium faecigallinarum TaxID=573741 RepID=A0A8J3AR29_9BURK|nr:hypothetical protein GCM10008066_23370 [Oxalicibacterium faecigallinarum]
MGKFFIDRPVFAWVLAIFILLAGGLAIKFLPVSQYPNIAPPAIVVTANYPGATAQTLDDSVTSLIEQEMNGADGLMYVESQSQANGQVQITVTFTPETNPDLAAVDVQNRLKRVEARLPSVVTQQGVQVTKSRSNFLLFIGLSSTDNSLDPIALGDYLSRNVLNEIRRVKGVGQAQLFGTERAMRIWVDPNKLVGLNLTPAEVTAAIRAQNALVAGGTLGELPSNSDQQYAATVVVNGQMTSPEEFGKIVLRANRDGSTVRLRDVARVEIGGQQYATSGRLNGNPTSFIGVQLSPTANALETAKLVHAKMDELSRYFPAGVKYEIPYDTSKFVQISIEEVVKTLIEAIILVFLVMFLFLQNIRYTIIPTIVVPVALAGTFATMMLFGFSINVLTMFGMVLSIGILVDDAIVVVENVERIMAEEGLSPRDATRKAMGQISGALVGITLADCRVHPDGILRWCRWSDLSSVFAGHRRIDGVLGTDGVHLDTGAVRNNPQTDRKRPASRKTWLLWLVQSQVQQHDDRLPKFRLPHADQDRSLDGGIRPDHRLRCIAVRTSASLVPAERRSGLYRDQRRIACRREPGAYARGHQAD